MLATAGRGVILWDAISGEELFRLPASELRVSRIAFSPDGTRLLLVTGDKDAAGPLVQIWDVSADLATSAWRGHDSAVFGLALSSDGKALASLGADRRLRVWRWGKDGLLRRTLDVECGLDSPEGSIYFTQNDTQMLTATEGKLRITVWDALTGKVVSDVRPVLDKDGPPRDTPITRLMPGGQELFVLDGGKSGRVDLKTGKSTQWPSLQATYPDWNACVVSPDSQWVATGSGSGELLGAGAKHYQASLLPLTRDGKHRSLGGQRWPIRQLAFSGDGKLLATVSALALTGRGAEVRVWNVEDGKEIDHYMLPGNGPCGAMFVGQGRTLFVWGSMSPHLNFADGYVVVRDVAEKRTLRTLFEPRGGVRSLVVLPGGQGMVLGLGDGTMVQR